MSSSRPALGFVAGEDAFDARRYAYAADLVSMTTAAGSFFYGHDGLGSVATVTSAAGKLQWGYLYEPYGVTLPLKLSSSAPANSVQFTGGLFDSQAGLLHLRARDYDPTTGRFLQPDPLPAPPTQPAVSAYAYADDRPSVLVDPSGLDSDSLGTGWIDWSAPALEFGYGAAYSFRVRSSAIGRALRTSESAAIRSNAGRYLYPAGRLAAFTRNPAFRTAGRALPGVTAALDLTGNLAAGQSPGEASTRAAGSTAGSSLGAVGGGLVCGFESVATAGVGVVACPVIVVTFAVGRGYAGDVIGGFLYDLFGG